MKKIIGIAAPARSGKDTIASMLLHHDNVIAYALADPLKLGCQILFGLTDEETWNDESKENIISLWQRSPREFFQHIGTDWMRVHNPEHWLMRLERAISSRIKTEALSLAPYKQDAQSPFKFASQAFFGLSTAQTWDSDYLDVVDKFWKMSPRQMFDLIESLTIKNFPAYFECRAQRPMVQPSKSIPFIDENNVIIIKDIRFENEADFLRRHNGIIWHILRNNAQKVNPHISEHGIKPKDEDILIFNDSSLEQLTLAVEKEWLGFINSASN